MSRCWFALHQTVDSVLAVFVREVIVKVAVVVLLFAYFQCVQVVYGIWYLTLRIHC